MGWFGYIKKDEAKKLIAEKLKSINVITKKNHSNDSFVFKNSASNFIQDCLDSKNEFHNKEKFYIDKPILIKESETSILSELSGTKGLQFYTDKPINIFEFDSSVNKEIKHVQIQGCTLRHFLPKNQLRANAYLEVEKGSFAGISLGTKDKPSYINNGKYNFDYFGNGRANVIDYDFDSARYGSSFTNNKIKGSWNNVHTGVKLVEDTPHLHRNGNLIKDITNTLDLDVEIWGADCFFDLQGLSFSKINVLGQSLKDSDKLLYNLDAEDIELSCFIYDTNKRPSNPIGKIKGKSLKAYGYSTRKGFVQIQAEYDKSILTK